MSCEPLSSERGFSAIELLIASTIVAGAIVAVLVVAQAAPETFGVEHELADMHQRLRVAQTEMFRDLVAAAAVRPYRWGGSAADPPGTFKRDTMTAIGRTSRTYWIEADERASVFRLMSSAGGASPDAPVVDNVVALDFEYLGEPDPPTGSHLVPIGGEQFTDGPWRPDETAVDRWDADLRRVRAIAVTIRVQAGPASLRGPSSALFARGGTAQSARHWAPDVETRFVVAPRNLTLEP